ncbi:HlyD family efflux transporter periplasmic adaptor subunit [Sphingomonas sp. H39-1-10]|uniref:HlyD family secretion protein n=1 Tax=Sphingomonas pollutisoli TaxID=3030829 RepID=UPI0023B94F35|nr:HlyD family efflux transporter periplasmic adaptor subunit [Sphingomonas pollutisoli]MDF0490153.1 HlyD family efflux transporter periplasmic adaptor subunit [Sphingomonas pollutisoli]
MSTKAYALQSENDGPIAERQKPNPQDRPAEPPPVQLYRPEALDGLRNKHGRPAPLVDVSIWIMVAFVLALLLAVGLFFSFTTFTRKETVEGWLQPDAGTATISLSRSGVVSRIRVTEGQFVRKGQGLFVISLEQTLADGRTLGERLLSANKQQTDELQLQLNAASASARSQQRTSEEKIASDQAQVRYFEGSISLQRARLELDRATLANYEELGAKGFVSKVLVRQQRAQVLTTQQAINETERQAAQSRADIAEAQSELARQRFDASQAAAQLRQGRAALQEKLAQNDAERTIIIPAPQDGRIVTLRATAGAPVVPGAPLATLLPTDSHLEAELWVPSRAVGFVRVGDEVRLMFDAFSFERFGTGKGRVISISTTPVDPKELPAPVEAKEVLFRVRVALTSQSITAYGRSWPLAPGSRLRGDLILERQSLFDWILDPLRAIKGRGL